MIIELKGGLGNQMFIYALYCSLKEHYKVIGRDEKILFDCLFYDQENVDIPLINEFFDLQLPKANLSQISKYKDCKRDFFTLVKHKLFHKHADKKYVDSEDGFQIEVFEVRDKMLSGYFQSEKYFKNVEARIRDLFRFNLSYLSDYQKNVAERIENSNSVAVHLRLGDYLECSDVFGGICDDLYYRNAFSLAYEPDSLFFVFSNDFGGAQEFFKDFDYNIVYVKEEEKYPQNNMDMYLISKCNKCIIANSSFSWWGAWLSNQCKQVIAPKRWLNNHEMYDICPEKWTRI